MEHFVTLERAIACPRASVSVAAETAAHVLTSAGYRRGLGFGPTSSYVRAYRPAWALALAIIGAIPTLGLSLFLLGYRRKDHCNVVIEDGPHGVVALVSGRVPAGLPAALEAASGDHHPVPPAPAGHPSQPPPPMLLSPSVAPQDAPSHTPQAILRPAAPMPPVEGFTPAPAPQPHPGPSFDPYPVPQSGPPDGAPSAQPPAAEPEPAPVPASPGPVRPPSRLAPPLPEPAGEQPAAHAAANGSPSAAPPPPVEDDPFSSTSGRVPWVGGGRPGPLPAPPAPATGVARGSTAVSEITAVLRTDNGDTLELAPFCLLGREPVARDDDPPAKLVRFDDPKLSVSKTHLAYGVDSQGVWVMDRNSTNGTTIIDPNGRRTPCAPGKREYLSPGHQVQIGQRRLAVEAPVPPRSS